ncbi:MAG: hypothetical protein ABI672_05545 [Vicinamibacteria bacterium]
MPLFIKAAPVFAFALVTAPALAGETKGAPKAAQTTVATATTPADQAEPMPEAEPTVRLSVEVKTHFRDSKFAESLVDFPFPASFLAPGQTQVFERTTARGPSFEISTVNLMGEANLTPHIHAGFQVNFLDLYDRNPTSSDDRVSLRQAWIRFGNRTGMLEAPTSHPFYAQFGKAPRFTKQLTRSMESYGLWGTAVGRFEEIGVEVGGDIGEHIYWRGTLVNGNPLFFRDPNLLAGDNGTPERIPGNTNRPISGTSPIYESGFPILYDAKAQDLNLSQGMQKGVGVGVRGGNADAKHAFDVVGWRFSRNLQERPAIRGSFYLGDKTLLRGVVFPLAFNNDDPKVEYGANLQARLNAFRVFGQFVHQDIADLVRKGAEVEASVTIPLNDIFLSGDTPVLTWIRPVFRFSNIKNNFTVAPMFPAPSIGWDWKKYDLGLRVGIIQNVDMTAEYSYHDVATSRGKLHPNEFVLTLRAGF